jgi:hypothetical protein
MMEFRQFVRDINAGGLPPWQSDLIADTLHASAEGKRSVLLPARNTGKTLLHKTLKGLVFTG